MFCYNPESQNKFILQSLGEGAWMLSGDEIESFSFEGVELVTGGTSFEE